MKNNLKKIKLLFLSTTLFIVSCSKDNYEDLLSKDNISMKVVILNSNAIKKETILFTKISKINQSLSRLNTDERNITSGVYNFSIDTDFCKMITLDSITSYSFNVIREPNNNDFENLVIKKLPNGNLISKLYKYNVTPEEKHNISHGIDVDMTDKIQVVDINDSVLTDNIFGRVYYSGSLCYQAEMIMTAGTPCRGEEHHAYGDLSCPFINSPYMQAQSPSLQVVYVPVDCGAGGGSGTSTGTGYTGGTSAGNGVITSPIVPTISIEEASFKEFKKNLTDEQYDWLIEQNENTEASILSYLSLNDFSAESQSFAKDIIDTSLFLDINAISIWTNDYNSFRNQMSNSERVIFDNLLQNRKMWYMVSAKKALDKAIELFPTTYIPSSQHNGKGDAFRHALWNAYCTGFFGATLAEQLTSAHEQQPNDPNNQFQNLETQMDLFNNNKGRLIAGFSNFNNVVQNTLTYLNIGQLVYLNNLNVNPPYFPTIYSVLIPTNQ